MCYCIVSKRKQKMTEKTHSPEAQPNDFESLRMQVQTDLLANDAVFGLVSSAFELDRPDELTPDFKLQIHYPRPNDQEAELLGVDKDELIGAGFRIDTGGKHRDKSLAEIAIGLSLFSYVRLGFFSRDFKNAAMYDNSGRLHVAELDKGGFAFEKDSVDHERMEAFAQWQMAHNKMIRASRTNSHMKIDPRMKIWTDNDLGKWVSA